MSPSTRTCARSPAASTSAGSASGRQPDLAASPARFTSIRTGSVRPVSRQHVSRRCRSATLSTEWIIANSSTARRALFPCRWPTRCQVKAPPAASAGIFSAASWTRFSPRITGPSAASSRMASAATVFDTATSRTDSGARPAARAARAIRSITSRYRSQSVLTRRLPAVILRPRL